ncbi:hypothetical protein FPHOBKDP_00063 [Listeria phage LPJP1]|nr:hypothetical protein FPHOBKDP_00063 [Listeria phage LPJP1]
MKFEIDEQVQFIENNELKWDKNVSKKVNDYLYLAINPSTGVSGMFAKRQLIPFQISSGFTTKLTKEQIKSSDERYWQFAVPIEEIDVG